MSPCSNQVDEPSGPGGRSSETGRPPSELDSFLYAVSHDLQRPIRHVRSFGDILRRRCEGSLGAESADLLDRVIRSAAEAQEMLNGLVRLSRVKTSGAPFAATDCNLVVDAAQRRLAAELEANEVALVRSSLPVVRADAAQLEEVFTCLIDNAVKFRKPDRDPRVDVSAEDGDGEWRFAVRDNGIGIDPRHWGRIFIVFQRLHTQREYPGLGLGLALCRAIVERHGGRIWVESEPGSGSTFRFTVSRDAIGG